MTMARLKIGKIGSPLLGSSTERVNRARLEDRRFRKLLKDMAETMRYHRGVGLAANQVGKALSVFVLGWNSNSRYPDAGKAALRVYINPRIVEYSKETESGWEGCLSIPGYRGLVRRSAKVTIEAADEEGMPVRETASGFLARVIQHETDHLNGLLYLDRMEGRENWMHLEEFNRVFGVKVRESE
jgi:peptide deformylase